MNALLATRTFPTLRLSISAVSIEEMRPPPLTIDPAANAGLFIPPAVPVQSEPLAADAILVIPAQQLSSNAALSIRHIIQNCIIYHVIIFLRIWCIQHVLWDGLRKHEDANKVLERQIKKYAELEGKAAFQDNMTALLMLSEDKYSFTASHKSFD